MNRFQRKATLVIYGAHAFVFFWCFVVLLWMSALKGCFQPKPKPEIVTFIEFGQPASPVAVQEVEQMQPPEPSPPEPTPPPVEPVKPAPIPEPTKKIIKPKVENKEPKVTPKKVEKPKWTPKKASEIDTSKAKRIEPVKPAVDPSEISQALKGVQSNEKLPTAPGPVGNPDADAAYIAQIGRFFDSKWAEPPNASPASSAIYRIYISQWGTITKRTKIQGSGDSAFDASVSAAVNSVSTAPKPPAGFPYDYVEVEFRIRN